MELRFARRAFVACCLLAASRSVAAAPVVAAPEEARPEARSEAREVATWRGEWRDAKRAREVPAKIYYPKPLKGGERAPLVVFSHGLGGSRDNYSYLGQRWASEGYVVVHLQHIGSDASIFKGSNADDIEANLKGAINASTVRSRPADVSFALDQLQALDKDAAWPLAGRIDFSKAAIAGHSFGSNTALLVVGMKLGGVLSLADARFKCAIAMSPSPPRGGRYAAMYGGISVPVLHMTGTKDESPQEPGGAGTAKRRIPFDTISRADGYLVTFEGGDHALFPGRRRPGLAPVATDERNHALILQATTLFLDATLKGDADALRSLRQEFPKSLGDAGTFEQKLKRG